MKNIMFKTFICILLVSSGLLFFACKKETPQANRFTVNFINTNISSIELDEGSLIPQPSTPVKEGYTFIGWFKDSEFSCEFDFSSQQIYEDMNIYAKWLKNPVLSYNPNGGTLHSKRQYTGSELKSTFTISDMNISKPGFIFTGWNSKRDGSGNEIKNSITITEDTTIYAQWKLATSNNALEQEFLTLLAQISTLEEKGYEYLNKEDFNDISSTVLSYIRSVRYADTSWSILAGAINSGFKKYVDNQSLSPDPRTLKELPTLNIFGQGPVDFVHMIGTLSLTYKKDQSKSDLGGWGGDCAQLATDIKNYDEDLDGLIEIAKSKFLNGGYFSLEDYNADLDAVVIASYMTNGKTLSEAIQHHYRQLADGTSREKLFFDIRFKNNTDTKEEFRNTCYNSFNKNYWINLWLDKNNIGENQYKNHIKASVYAFSDYLYDCVYNK